MYCRNCGNELSEHEDVCLKCGVKAGKGNKYCPNCGQAVDENASVCVHCGTKFAAPKEPKSKLVAGLLGIFLGGFGVHNFYLGYNKKAIIQVSVSVACILLTASSMIVKFLSPKKSNLISPTDSAAFFSN